MIAIALMLKMIDVIHIKNALEPVRLARSSKSARFMDTKMQKNESMHNLAMK